MLLLLVILSRDHWIRRLWKIDYVVFGWKEKRGTISPFFNDWLLCSYLVFCYSRSRFSNGVFKTRIRYNQKSRLIETGFLSSVITVPKRQKREACSS